MACQAFSVVAWLFLILVKGGDSAGPAYDRAAAQCPTGGRVVQVVNNCKAERWFKFDGRTTPHFARPQCEYASVACGTTPGSDPMGIVDCGRKIREKFGVDAGVVYCVSGHCQCNPDFKLSPGSNVKIAIPNGADWQSGTGWIAEGCNKLGGQCVLGESAARNSLFEFTYTSGHVWYDISAVDAWTSVSPVGIRACGNFKPDPHNRFWCGAAGCDFDVQTQCPDGSNRFAAASGPDGNSAHLIPTGTVFNRGNVGGEQWTWNGPPDFARKFGKAEGQHSNRRFKCNAAGCQHAANWQETNSCLSGCDYCTIALGGNPESDVCIKYCCPDEWRTYEGSRYRFDSAGCRALGVQQGTDYTATLNNHCKLVYTYAYEDRTSTFECDGSVSLQIMACPEISEFPLH